MIISQHGVNQMIADPVLIATESSPTSKPRRVRTGCLTCRERHLKCDEAQPVCQNCRKSNRQCKRGVRLNFIDTQVRTPPRMAPVRDWNVQFHDESREIASEYKGGLAKYGLPEEGEQLSYRVENGMLFDFSGPTSHSGQPPPLPAIHGIVQDPYAEEQMALAQERQQRETSHHYNHSHSDSAYSGSNVASMTAPSYAQVEHPVSAESRDYIRDPKELYCMQAFVEEVALWMDCLDAHKHFSEELPHRALANNMLYNSFLACGARHLALVHPQEQWDENATQFYNTATSYLLQNLQNDKRDTFMCATTATILNVYEVMSERYIQRMNHIKGARALIKECGWNAKSAGVGAACFWINVMMEVLDCMTKNVPVAWDPADWGVDMDFASNTTAPQSDEVWTQRILYIMSKIVNFRARSSAEGDLPLERQTRMGEWQHLKSQLDTWNRLAPRTMHPMGCVDAFKTTIGSVYPEVWLIKRTAIMARLLYHTGLVLLSRLNPMDPRNKSAEMRDMEQENAMMICGIVTHTKDRGVACVSIRSMAIASENFTDAQQQNEVLAVIKSIAESSGWNLGAVLPGLLKQWGWTAPPDSPSSVTRPPQQQQAPAPPPLPTLPQMPQHPQPSVAGPSAAPIRVQSFPQIGVHAHQQPAPSHQQQSMTPPSQGHGALQQQSPSQARNPLPVTDFNLSQQSYQPHYVAQNPNMGSASMSRHGSSGYF
ncbi:uncharacterized protein PV09_06702 [Verruconis gallopava]|uniref:Zn(2)-C6 fungal-type domain-containing protein n=1 Tax=Verruconis gallopava TaxID=253628 RepID=A0A0D2A504_9PEZI|nr:uncharacterized protein PV09_06702 [Verruconis gallopava]KIW01853.1 hypothetical protein PV09_06702 [Verruconis gallopava]